MPQVVKCHSQSERSVGLVPGQGTCIGCGLGPRSEHCDFIIFYYFLSNEQVILPGVCVFIIGEGRGGQSGWWTGHVKLRHGYSKLTTVHIGA